METAIDMTPKFSSGRLVITSEVIDTVSDEELFEGLSRHVCGDWGDISGEDWVRNDLALREDWPVYSAYRCKESGKRFWVYTKHDRSETVVFLPMEK
jgi:hypothetical protein